jgi:hypothetical protein
MLRVCIIIEEGRSEAFEFNLWLNNEEQLYSREYSVLLFSESSTGNSCCMTDVGGIL